MKKYFNVLIALGFLAVLVYGSYQHKQIRKFYRYIHSSIKRTDKTVKLEEYLHLFLPDLDASQWVSRYIPEKAFNGYNLMFFKSRVPILVDMNGNIVHAWPNVRARSRIRLSKNGNLLIIGSDTLIKEYDWNGKLIWKFRVPEEADFPHHDVIKLKSGNIVASFRDSDKTTDYLLEFNSNGEVVWEWHFFDYLEKDFYGKITTEEDFTHINSVQELPLNMWYEEGDLRFRPGNLLVSARHLNTIFIVDKETKDVVWQYSEDLDYQHEALMIEKGHPGDGNILIFNNGYNNYYNYRRSSIVEINPSNQSVEWEYSSKYFFSSKGSIEQSLPNGNVLISSNKGGRVFEITRDGEIVWEWIPPFDPIRPQRYPYDHCPQFEELGEASEVAVHARNVRPFIDRDLYSFGLAWEIVDRDVFGKKRKTLKSSSMCRALFIPAEATLEVGYGLDQEKMRKYNVSSCNGLFKVRIKPQTNEEGILLLEDTVNSSEDTVWFERKFRLHDYAYQVVLLCLEAECQKAPGDGDESQFALWQNPSVISDSSPTLDMSGVLEDLTVPEKKVVEQQLRALGYIE